MRRILRSRLQRVDHDLLDHVIRDRALSAGTWFVDQAIEPMLGLTGIVGGTALYRVPDAALCTDLALKR